MAASAAVMAEQGIRDAVTASIVRRVVARDAIAMDGERNATSIAEPKENRILTSAFLVLRWVGLLPVALLATLLASIALNMMNQIVQFIMGFEGNNLLTRIYQSMVTNLILGAVFVYVGVRVAPSYRTFVCYGMALLAIVHSGVLLYPEILDRHYWAIWSYLCFASGAVAVAYSVYNGEMDTES